MKKKTTLMCKKVLNGNILMCKKVLNENSTFCHPLIY